MVTIRIKFSNSPICLTIIEWDSTIKFSNTDELISVQLSSLWLSI
jgi:hypothetical protein